MTPAKNKIEAKDIVKPKNINVQPILNYMHNIIENKHNHALHLK